MKPTGVGPLILTFLFISFHPIQILNIDINCAFKKLSYRNGSFQPNQNHCAVKCGEVPPSFSFTMLKGKEIENGLSFGIGQLINTEHCVLILFD